MTSQARPSSLVKKEDNKVKLYPGFIHHGDLEIISLDDYVFRVPRELAIERSPVIKAQFESSTPPFVIELGDMGEEGPAVDIFLRALIFRQAPRRPCDWPDAYAALQLCDRFKAQGTGEHILLVAIQDFWQFESYAYDGDRGVCDLWEAFIYTNKYNNVALASELLANCYQEDYAFSVLWPTRFREQQTSRPDGWIDYIRKELSQDWIIRLMAGFARADRNVLPHINRYLKDDSEAYQKAVKEHKQAYWREVADGFKRALYEDTDLS